MSHRFDQSAYSAVARFAHSGVALADVDMMPVPTISVTSRLTAPE